MFTQNESGGKCLLHIYHWGAGPEVTGRIRDTGQNFYVLLTVHLGIILVNDQLDAQFFFRICLSQISTCFEHSRAHCQEN